MKILFCTSIIIVCLLVLICDFMSFKKNVKVSSSVCLVLSIGFFTLLSYMLSVAVLNTKLSDFFIGIYFLSIDWLLTALIEYCYIASNKKRLVQNNILYSYIRDGIFIFIIADTVSILLNNFLHHAYESTLNYNYYYNFTYRTYKYFIGFNIHLYICYFLVAIVFYVLLSSVINSPKHARSGFVSILIGFIAVIFFNVLYLVQNWKMDYSILVYGALTILIYYFSIYSTERKKLELMTTLYAESIKSAVFCYDFEKKCIYINKKAYEIFNDEKKIQEIAENYLKTPWLNKSISNRTDLITGNETFYIEDEIHYFNVEYRIFRDNKNAEIGSYLRFTDNTNEIIKINNEKLNATHDQLTGLYNKQSFFQKAEEIIKSDLNIKRYLVVTNICDFKFINDVFGSETGDKILREQARMLSFAAYKDCICGRISSDRFAMLIKKENFSEELATANNKQLQEITKSLNFRLRINIGVYEITDKNESIESMFDRANLIIDSKNNAKNNLITYYDKELMDKIISEKKIQTLFLQSFANKEFDVVYQPIFDSKNTIHGYEALVRWNSNQVEKMLPSVFIPVLERSVAIYQLDTFVWNTVCGQIKEMEEKGVKTKISVNISSLDFYYTNLYVDMMKLIEKWQISPASFILEISEDAILNNKKENLEVINELQKIGFDFIFDNFGNGFNSLFLLNEVKPIAVKINVTDLDSSEKSFKILKKIVSISHKLGVKIIASRVENQQIVELLADSDCNYYQGNYFSLPLRPEKL